MSIPFLTLFQNYECLVENEWVECQPDKFCETDTEWRYDFSSDTSLHNWVQKYDLTCAPKSSAGMIGSMCFFGNVTTLLWLPRLADIYGRRGIFFSSIVFLLCLLVVLLVNTDIKVGYFIFFIIGCSASARVNVGFVYLMEFIPSQNQIATCTCFNISTGIIGILISVHFYSVSKHWEYLVIPGLFSCLVALPLSYYYESPKFLLKKHRFEEA